MIFLQRSLCLVPLFAVALSAQSLTILNTSFSPGTVGTAYTAGLSVSGGTAPYRWTATGSLPPGLTVYPVGVISGTPTTGGTFSFSLSVVDAIGTSALKSFSIVIAGSTTPTTPTTPSTPAASIAITTAGTLPAGTVGVSYNQTLSTNSTAPPFRWSAGQGMPPGLTLDPSAGTISGTPTSGGAFTFAVQLADAAGGAATATFSLTIGTAALTISTPAPLSGGTVGTPYVQKFSVSGGQAPYAWYIGSGATGGLTLDQGTGILQGTPLTAGTFTFTVLVTDSTGISAFQTYSLVINTASLTVTRSSSLPSGTIGVIYSQKLPVSANGGTAPYTWSLTGNIPGLTFDAAGVALTGTPTTPGTFTLTVQVRDSTGATAAQTLTLTITAAPLSLTTAPTADAVLNVPFSLTIGASGGVTPYHWVATGLPAGLSINAATGQISGTPTAAGTFAVAVTLNDSAATTAVIRFTLTVRLPTPPSVTITGLAGTVLPAHQFSLQVVAASPYALPIAGQATLTFTPDSGPADKTIAFASGGTTANFTIPAGGTNAVSDTPLAIQTGTVSGVIAISLRLQAAGVDITPTPAPTITAQIARDAPTIGSAVTTRTSNSISVVITGYSTAREITQAVFTFSAAAGQSLQTSATSITVDVSAAFATWFQNAANSQFGSQFVLTQPFAVQGDPTAVIPVSVTLTNRYGSTVLKVTP